MKDRKNERYVKLGLTLFAALTATLAAGLVFINLKGFAAGLHAVLNILSPFVYGAVIAYLVIPLCRKLENLFGRWLGPKRAGGASALAIVVSLLAAVLIVLAVLVLIVPQLAKSIAGLIQVVPGQAEALWQKAEAALQADPEGTAWLTDLLENVDKRVETWTKTDMLQTVQTLLTGLAGGVMDAAGIMKNVLLGLIVAIYLLARRVQLSVQARLVLRGLFKPAAADWVEREVRYADRMFNGFFMGKLLDSAIVGVLCFLGCLAMGFESPVLIAVIVGVTNIIPFFGPFIGAVPCALLLLLENPVHCLVFLVFIVILQQLDGNVIGPRILGNTTGLSGLWVMFSILLFGGLWGIGGMIVAVPQMAVIYDVIRQLTFVGLRRQGQEAMIDAYNTQFHGNGTDKEG